MECTQCEMQLNADANFCARCGRQIERSAFKSEANAVEVAAVPSQAPVDTAMQDALAAALRANTLSGGLGVKSQHAPYAVLPTSPSTAAVSGEKLSGQSVHALLAQANLHRMRHRWDDAIECCVDVLRIQPANQTAHVLLGDIYRDQNRLDDAIQWYGMAVDLRPNPTDQAKLEQVIQARDRMERSNVLRIQRGYGNSSVSAIDRGTDLNTGTTNLMGLSPRRWLRGITATSLGFVVLVLIGLAWNAKRGHTVTSSKAPNTPAPFGRGSFDMPAHRLDKTPPAYQVAQAANGNRIVVTGGAGLAPDRNPRTTTAPLSPQNTPVPGPSRPGSTLPTFGSAAPASAGPAPLLNIPPAPVQNVQPLPNSAQPQSGASALATTPPPSNRLTDGLQHAQTVNDGGVGATVLLSGAPSLVLDNSPRGQEIMLRNVYRAARTAFANNTMLMRVKVFIETQTPTSGQAVILEAEVDRSTANNANPDTDSATSLQSRLAYFHYTGNVSAPVASPVTETGQQ